MLLYSKFGLPVDEGQYNFGFLAITNKYAHRKIGVGGPRGGSVYVASAEH